MCVKTEEVIVKGFMHYFFDVHMYYSPQRRQFLSLDHSILYVCTMLSVRNWYAWIYGGSDSGPIQTLN